MGERDNHIDQGTSLSPERNYAHMHMVRERYLLMKRCSPEDMKETAATAATTTATATAVAMTLGGSGPWPPSSLEMVLLWRLIFPQDGCQGGGNFVVPFDLGFLSLYRLSDSRHPYYVFSILGLEGASELRLGRILSLYPPEKNSSTTL